MKSVLFIGDINVDIIMGGLASLPVVDKEIMCRNWEVVLGSSAVLSACAYAGLGGVAEFMGLAGQDDYGNFMLTGLKEFGIGTSRIRRTDRVRTGVTVNMIYKSTRTQVTYGGTIPEFDGAEIREAELAGVGHIHLAGMYQQHKLRPHITRILNMARSMNITSSIDPQWDATEQWEGMDEWLPLLTYLFVNESEAISITRSGTNEEAARRLASRTPCAIVKAGPNGSLCQHDGKLFRSPAKLVDVVDTTGAGDCFDSGFLYATIERKLAVPQALCFANALGSRSCLYAGGTAHRSTYDQVIQFMKED